MSPPPFPKFYYTIGSLQEPHNLKFLKYLNEQKLLNFTQRKDSTLTLALAVLHEVQQTPHPYTVKGWGVFCTQQI